jgi:hypothetical protein
MQPAKPFVVALYRAHLLTKTQFINKTAAFWAGALDKLGLSYTFVPYLN